MRDIIKDYGKSETEKKERGVLDEYAEMCRYQNERQRKNNEDFSDEDLAVDEQEDIDSGKEQNLKRENTQNEKIKISYACFKSTLAICQILAYY